MHNSVLVIDDEVSIQNSLKGALSDEGYTVTTCSSGAEGLEILEDKDFDVVLLDIWMEGMDGLEVLKKIKQIDTDQPVIMMSGHGTIETAVKATKLGAFDFIEKPLSLEKILILISNAVQNEVLIRENKALRNQFTQPKELLGESPSIRMIRDLIKRAAPTKGSVLITGENGTGKEVAAKSLHTHSDRYNQPFIEVNCAAIPEELIESELFGHEKGAFTGATQRKRGKFDLADKGTLFLDEIGDMSLKTQAKILRILQEQKFERVGGSETIVADVRIIAATNKDLKEEIKKQNFREDLYYRLNVLPIHIPPLKERKEDIKTLANYFSNYFTTLYQKKPRSLTQESLFALSDYSWPGNVRELKNLIERLIILTKTQKEGLPITAGDILEHIQNDTPLNEQNEINAENKNLKDAKHEFEKNLILKTLRENEGNISKTASQLGIERSHLHKKIKSYGVDD